MKELLFIIGFIIMTLDGIGQLELNVELRPRGEVRHGYKIIPSDSADVSVFVSQRTRLNFYYSHPKFKVGFSLQDVRVWGDEQLFNATGSYGDNASLDMNEGWLEILAGKSQSFKIGRQYWVYEDERLLSRRNWNQYTIKYDGLLYKFEPEKIKIHIGLSLNNNTDNLLGNEYNSYKEILQFDSVLQTIVTKKEILNGRLKSQNFLYITTKISDRLDLSFQALATGFQKPETASTIYVKGTYGLYLNYKPGKFGIRANGFYQNGKNISGKKVSAYFASLRGEIKLKPVSINAGCDYHSGQDQVKEKNNYQNTDHFFDLFYGARHKYYGYMDFFDNLSKSSKNGGLVDIYSGVGINVTEKALLSVDYHYFSLQSRIYDPYLTENILKKELGSELDFTLNITIIPEISISGGLSAMLPTTGLEKLQGFENGGTGFAYWGWCMITAKPVLFSNKK